MPWAILDIQIGGFHILCTKGPINGLSVSSTCSGPFWYKSVHRSGLPAPGAKCIRHQHNVTSVIIIMSHSTAVRPPGLLHNYQHNSSLITINSLHRSYLPLYLLHCLIWELNIINHTVAFQRLNETVGGEIIQVVERERKWWSWSMRDS